uniref:Uncharacterized protein n=1 Tax=Myotis myotis TaxID=51298 RepID=A0A7J7WHV3_MYOMY|nr:hypothetical protein mMyoMyo1_012152 [Myotis myotis]
MTISYPSLLPDKWTLFLVSNPSIFYLASGSFPLFEHSSLCLTYGWCFPSPGINYSFSFIYFLIIFIRVYLSQTDDICQGARCQMLPPSYSANLNDTLSQRLSLEQCKAMPPCHIYCSYTMYPTCLLFRSFLCLLHQAISSFKAGVFILPAEC